MSTYMQGAIKSGDSPSEYQNVGYAVFAQTKLVDFVAESGGGNDNVDVTIQVPVSAQVHSINVDTLTAWDSVTSAGLTVGTSDGGTQFLSSSDVKSAGREAPTLTAAQLALWDDVGSTNTLHIRVAQSGNTTAGQARVTVLYSPKQ